jgi:hypothetical protein
MVNISLVSGKKEVYPATDAPGTSNLSSPLEGSTILTGGVLP